MIQNVSQRFDGAYAIVLLNAMGEMLVEIMRVNLDDPLNEPGTFG